MDETILQSLTLGIYGIKSELPNLSNGQRQNIVNWEQG